MASEDHWIGDHLNPRENEEYASARVNENVVSTIYRELFVDAQFAPGNESPAQKVLLRRVQAMTRDEIAALPPATQKKVRKLKEKFLPVRYPVRWCAAGLGPQHVLE